MRVSLRELLIFVAAIALAIVSLRSGSLFWHGLVGLIAMLAMGITVIAGIFERGDRRAFAIGAAVMMCGYALLIAAYRNAESKSPEGILPTSVLLRALYPAFDHSGYVFSETGNPVPPDANMTANADGMRSVNGRPVHFAAQPVLESFMSIGHSWILLLFGYVGARFARFTYVQRTTVDRSPD
jgi:hypothetical protein